MAEWWLFELLLERGDLAKALVQFDLGCRVTICETSSGDRAVPLVPPITGQFPESKFPKTEKKVFGISNLGNWECTS